MTATEYHYTTYIKSTPEKVWAAITNPEFAHQYWGNANFSDWKQGSRWEHRTTAGAAVITGIVRECVPPKRLVLSWAGTGDHDDPAKHSRVTFEIGLIKDMIRLHVTHDHLVAGSDMAKGISGGWPRVLSSMKSLLETGIPLDTWAGFESCCH
ncbi:MAG: SRPBCC family protein [Planctomycetes bacterium]|nr:SRPBCC family protein [Planctomycetota bacterium]